MGPDVAISPQEGPRFYRWVAALIAFLLWPFVRIDTRRLDVARRVTTAVVIANHRSLLDPLVALVAIRRLRRYPSVMVAERWFGNRVTGPLLRRAGAIPVARGNPHALLEAARSVVATGVPVLILPEGKLAGEPGEPTSTETFKTGAARIASGCRVGVWPLAMVGTDEVWPRGARLPRLGTRRTHRVTLLGGAELIEVGDDPRRATAELRAAVVDLLGEAVAIHAGSGRR